MAKAKTLKEMITSGQMVVAPGAYDCITARLIEQAGYPAVYMTGAGTSAARGYPDFGLLSMSEMVDNAAVMARAVGIPLIADADTGYGNELNVTRTVREYEARGVAAIHIEDQVAPKRCGHLDGKEVISRAEFVSKIRAAVEARHSSEIVIIARWCCRAWPAAARRCGSTFSNPAARPPDGCCRAATRPTGSTCRGSARSRCRWSTRPLGVFPAQEDPDAVEPGARRPPEVAAGDRGVVGL